MGEKRKDTLVNRQRYASTFNKELLQGLKDLSDRTMIPTSKLLDKALELLLEEYKNK
jgi:hypothetical protein